MSKAEKIAFIVGGIIGWHVTQKIVRKLLKV